MINSYARLQVLLLLIIFPLCTGAQTWGEPSGISFDHADTFYHKAIFIDTESYHHNSWQIGHPNKTVFDSAHSGPNAILTDTIDTYPPNDTSVFILGLRNYYFTGAWWHAISSIDFYYKLDIDTGSRGVLELSSDTGRTWQIAHYYDESHPDTITFTQSSTGWQHYSIFIGDLDDDSTLLRFTFISDSDTSTKDGWMIDDINIDYWTEDVPIITGQTKYHLYPNPTNTNLAIATSGKIGTVIISNSIGQIVHNKQYINAHEDINVSQLPPGIYFLNINGIAAGKFLKE